MAFLLIGISIVLMLFFNISFIQLILDNSEIIIKILYLTAIAMGISTAIHFVIPEDFAEKHLRDNKLSHLFYATLLGVLTPGPVYAIYPIVIVLKKKGVKNPILVFSDSNSTCTEFFLHLLWVLSQHYYLYFYHNFGRIKKEQIKK